MALYLIRHGQSTVNAANMEANYSGLVYHEEQYRDAPLNETGVSQAREAAKRFSSSSNGQGCVSHRSSLRSCVGLGKLSLTSYFLPIFWYIRM